MTPRVCSSCGVRWSTGKGETPYLCDRCGEPDEDFEDVLIQTHRRGFELSVTFTTTTKGRLRRLIVACISHFVWWGAQYRVVTSLNPEEEAGSVTGGFTVEFNGYRVTEKLRKDLRKDLRRLGFKRIIFKPPLVKKVKNA
jgi:hypothetical protein